jgi:SAM-dependent methyltransferase
MTSKEVHDYWNARPCNIRHSDKEVGTKEYFDEVEAKKHKVEPHILTFAEFERWKGKRVLEIGCGIGTAAVKFARAGAIYTGIDLTENAIELAKKRFEVLGLEGNFFVMDAEKELPEGPFDLVYSFGVIHHTPNPTNIVERIANEISPNGELRIMVYSKWSYKLFWIMNHYDDGKWTFDESMDQIVAKYSEAQTGCPVTHTYSLEEVTELLSSHFAVNSVWKDHIFKYEIEPYKRGEYVVSDEFSGMSEERFGSMCKELGWHTMVIAHPH